LQGIGVCFSSWTSQQTSRIFTTEDTEITEEKGITKKANKNKQIAVTPEQLLDILSEE
jgi:hypothetical protein